MALADILATCGQNAPGVNSVFYIIEAHDVQTIPPVGVDGMTIATDIVCKTGKKFVKIECAPQTSEFNATGSGEPNYISVANEFMFSVPGISVDKKNLLRTLVGCPVIVLFKNKGDVADKYTLLGNLDEPAYLGKVDYKSGKTTGDKNGYDYMIKDFSGKDLNYYTGDIESLLVAA